MAYFPPWQLTVTFVAMYNITRRGNVYFGVQGLV